MFRLRDAFWLVALISMTTIAAVVGFQIAELRQTARAASKASHLEFRLWLYEVRLEQLKTAMKKAGVEIPPPDDDEPYPE